MNNADSVKGSATPHSTYMKSDLDIYIRARYPLLWIVTSEEMRVLYNIEEVARKQRKRMLYSPRGRIALLTI